MAPRCYSDPEADIDAMIDGRIPMNSGGFRHAGTKAQGSRGPTATLGEAPVFPGFE